MAKGWTGWLAPARGFALTVMNPLSWPEYAGTQTITIFELAVGAVCLAPDLILTEASG